MNTSLFILPCLSVFVFLGSLGLKSIYPDHLWMFYSSLSVGVGLLVLWVLLDIEGFKNSFRKKGAKLRLTSFVAMILGLIVVVGVCNLSNRTRFNKNIDLTKDKLNSLSEQSRNIIKVFNDENISLTINGYFSAEGFENSFKEILSLYKNAGLNYYYTKIDPNVDPAKAVADKITVLNTVVLKAKDKDVKVTTFNEEKITNALLSLYQSKVKKIYFISTLDGSSLSNEEAQGFSNVNLVLTSNGYQVESLSLLEKGEVPEDASLVVFAGAKYDLKKEEVSILDNYISKGGAFLSMVDALVNVDNLNVLLSKYGFKYENDVLEYSQKDPRSFTIGRRNIMVGLFDQYNPITVDFAKDEQNFLLWPNTRSVSEIDGTEYSKTILAKTYGSLFRIKNVKSPKDVKPSVNEMDSGVFPVMEVGVKKIEDKNQNKDKKEVNEEAKENKENEEDNKVSKESRIVVSGSSSFITNMSLAQRAENIDFFMNTINYLTQDEDFISIRPKSKSENSSIDLTTQGSQLSLLFLSFIYPFIFLGIGIVVWLRRRQK